MDSKIKEQIDNIFKKHQGNTICLDLYGNIDYGDRAQEEWWPERIEDFSNELKLEQTYGEIKMDKIIFANLGVEDSDITDEDNSMLFYQPSYNNWYNCDYNSGDFNGRAYEDYFEAKRKFAYHLKEIKKQLVQLKVQEIDKEFENE